MPRFTPLAKKKKNKEGGERENFLRLAANILLLNERQVSSGLMSKIGVTLRNKLFLPLVFLPAYPRGLTLVEKKSSFQAEWETREGVVSRQLNVSK